MASVEITSHYVEVNERRLHYREAGAGSCVLLLHGWPTNSWLWREVMPGLADGRRVIALDLPGFGLSEKRLEDSYSFRYYERTLDAFLKVIGEERVDLVVHDLGGPVGVYWALQRQEHVRSLTLLNTLLYPEFHWSVKAFVLATLVPGVRRWLSHPRGIAATLRFGVENKQRLTDAVLQPYLAPYQDSRSRRVLLKTASRLQPQGFEEIARLLPEFRRPVRLIYGENDRILPDVARTMQRVRRDLPRADLTALPASGHFLQEDAGVRVGELVAEFLRSVD